MLEDFMVTSHLEHFAVVYRRRSYSKAAKSIPMSLQGVIKSIRTLENSIGYPLFISKNNVLTPTPYADKLYALTRRWVEDTNELASTFKQISSDVFDVIRLGAAIGTPGLLGIDFTVRFSNAHPDIQVEMTESTDLVCDESLLNGECAIALVIAPFNEAFETLEIYETPVSVWIPRDHPLSERDYIYSSDLADQNLGMIDRNCKVNSLMMEAFERGCVQPKTLLTTAELFWLRDFAISGKGIGLSVPHVATCFDEDNRIVSVPVLDVRWKVGIACRRDHVRSENENLLVSYITELAAGLRRG